MPFPEDVWRKGFEPDIRVVPTVEDVIRDKDRVLAAALHHLMRIRPVGHIGDAT
jgi:hypothetical protein